MNSVAGRVVRKFIEDQAPNWAALIAWNALFAMFPIVIFAASIIGYALRLAETIGLAKDFGPHVTAYWQRLQARDGYKRAVAAENLAGEQQKVARRS